MFNPVSCLWSTNQKMFNPVSCLWSTNQKMFNSVSSLWYTNQKMFKRVSCMWSTNQNLSHPVSCLWSTNQKLFNPVSCRRSTNHKYLSCLSILLKRSEVVESCPVTLHHSSDAIYCIGFWTSTWNVLSSLLDSASLINRNRCMKLCRSETLSNHSAKNWSSHPGKLFVTIFFYLCFYSISQRCKKVKIATYENEANFWPFTFTWRVHFHIQLLKFSAFTSLWLQ